jgi:hypothetical protein
MNRPRNFVCFSARVLLITGVVQLREASAIFSAAGLAVVRYVSTADGSVTVIDLVRLAAVAISLNGLPKCEASDAAEIWGVSSAGGYVLGG